MLYIKASPRGGRSYSTKVADEFAKVWRGAGADRQVEVLDLFAAPLAQFDAAAAEGKYALMKGAEAPEPARRAWQEVTRTIDHFKSFDRYLLAVPMWNFGLPHRLKLYLDTIIQPTLTFAVSDAGYQGLVQGKKAMVVCACGGQYDGEAAALDHLRPYLDLLLGFIGIVERSRVSVEGTLAPGAEERLHSAVAEAARLAASW
jgi:FMN-dependent NADH-azoreductase